MAKAGISHSCCCWVPPCSWGNTSRPGALLAPFVCAALQGLGSASHPPPAVDPMDPLWGLWEQGCVAMFTGSSGLCAVDTRPHAVVLGPGIRCAFFHFLVYGPFGPDGLNTSIPGMFKPGIALPGRTSDEVNPRDSPGRGKVILGLQPHRSPSAQESALRGQKQEATGLSGF